MGESSRNGVSRRDFVRKAGIGAAGLAVTRLQSCAKPPATKPNIIYIMADDLGYGDPGCYGQEKIRTPNIDRMAAGGMRFMRHYAGSTVCAPSRCCLMTGFHTGHAYIRGNREVQPEGQWPIPSDSVTVAELLQEAGYATGMAGKWGLGGPGSAGAPNMQGFGYFYGYNCQRKAHFFYPEYLWENEEKVILEGNANERKEIYSHDLITGKALDFIESNRENPFFLYLPYTIPHAELAVPEDSLVEYLGDFPEKPFGGGHYGAQESPRAAYAAMISRMDRDIGRIRTLLERRNIERNTLIIFTSDNGPHGEGGNNPTFFNSSGGLRGMKRDLYEGGIRVPMIACWPDRIRAGSVSDHISAFWDFMPTACQIAGIEPPAGIDGISLLPELTGAMQSEHEYLYWEFHEQGKKQAVLRGDWKAVRLKVFNEPDGPIELYDLRDDPAEEKNIADSYPRIVAEMRDIMRGAHTPSPIWPLSEAEADLFIKL